MDYKDYDIEDFAADPFFVSWVKQPNASSERFWEKWLQNHPEKAETVHMARQLISTAGYKHRYTPSEAEYLQVLEKIHQNRRSKLHRLTTRKPLYLRWQPVAAVITFILLAGIGLYTAYQTPPEVETGPMAKHLADTVLKIVPKGQKLLVTLPDGSQVKINSGSKLWYYTSFSKTDRKVFLEGEAFFNVTKDPEHSFQVITPDLTTEVLGTAFNVKAYNGTAQTKVVVEHGKVKSNNIEKSTILTAGEMVVYDAESREVKTRKADLQRELAWKENIILLEKTKFTETIAILEKWYGVTFIVPETMQVEGSMNGKFKDASLENVLDGLDFATEISYQLAQDTVWLYPKNMPMK